MKPDKTGHPLYMTFPDCSGLFTGSVWPGLVFFRVTGKKQSSKVGNGQNQSKPDAEKQTCDRLVRPDFMYQTDTRKSLVFAFGTRFWSLSGYRHVAPTLALVAGSWPLWPHVVGLAGKARDKANVGLMGGRRHPIKVPHGVERKSPPIAIHCRITIWGLDFLT